MIKYLLIYFITNFENAHILKTNKCSNVTLTENNEEDAEESTLKRSKKSQKKLTTNKDKV